MAGRKRKNAGELREPICFSVSPITKQMAARLRAAGVPLGALVEDAILQAFIKQQFVIPK